MSMRAHACPWRCAGEADRIKKGHERAYVLRPWPACFRMYCLILVLISPEKGHSKALGDGTPFAIEHALHNELDGYGRHSVNCLLLCSIKETSISGHRCCPLDSVSQDKINVNYYISGS